MKIIEEKFSSKEIHEKIIHSERKEKDSKCPQKDTKKGKYDKKKISVKSDLLDSKEYIKFTGEVRKRENTA